MLRDVIIAPRATRALKKLCCEVVKQSFFLSCLDPVALPPGLHIIVVDQACLVDVEQPEGLHRRTLKRLRVAPSRLLRPLSSASDHCHRLKTKRQRFVTTTYDCETCALGQFREV